MIQVIWKEVCSGHSEAELLSIAASLERHSAHPIAACIVANAAASNVPLDLDVGSTENVPGMIQCMSCM